MYEINRFPQIIYHLKNISSMFVDKGSHYMMFCVFCNDATRKDNPSHGHCYVSKELPVYYCHRCNSAGTILKLLFYTNFQDSDTINQLKGFVKFNFVKDYIYQKQTPKTNYYDTVRYVKNKIFNINKEDLELFENYVYQRLGCINYSEFFIYPDYINPYNNEVNLLSVCFNNNVNQFIEGRFINPFQNLRYKKNKQHYHYYFQEWSFEKINNVIIAEGIFDLLNTYIYNKFDKGFYLSMSGKRYLTMLESLIYRDLLTKECRINLIFDNDNNYIQSTIWKCRRLTETINNNIEIVGYKPLENFKDIGEYPSLEKI